MSDEDIATEADRDAGWEEYLAELDPAEAARYRDADEEEAAFVAAGEHFAQQYQPAPPPVRNLQYLRGRVEACSHAELSSLYGEVLDSIRAEGLTLDRVEHDGIFRSTGGG